MKEKPTAEYLMSVVREATYEYGLRAMLGMITAGTNLDFFFKDPATMDEVQLSDLRDPRFLQEMERIIKESNLKSLGEESSKIAGGLISIASEELGIPIKEEGNPMQPPPASMLRLDKEELFDQIKTAYQAWKKKYNLAIS